MADSMLNQNETGKTNDKEEKLVEYQVENTCWWNEQLWHVDDVVKLPESIKPPAEHFKKL